MFQQDNQVPLEKSISHLPPHLGVMEIHLCIPHPFKSLFLIYTAVQQWAGRWGDWTPLPSVPPPQIVPGCIWWHSHLTGIAFQSVPSDWTWCFLPVCGNGALIPSSQGYFHLNDLFHLTGVSVHYPHTFPFTLPAKDVALHVTFSAVNPVFDTFQSATLLPRIITERSRLRFTPISL